jgi:hypothetical protein
VSHQQAENLFSLFLLGAADSDELST